ncbi:hypothetical protein D3C73_1325890 [compost metagenome]
MVAGSNGEVFHASIFCRFYNIIGIKQGRIELFVQVIVIGFLHLFVSRPADFGATQTYRPPVDKHAETFIHKIFHYGRVCFSLCIGQVAQEAKQQEINKFCVFHVVYLVLCY